MMSGRKDYNTEYNRQLQKQLEEAERKRLAAIEEARRLEQQRLAEERRLAALAEAERLQKQKLMANAEEERLKLLALANKQIKEAEAEKEQLEQERLNFISQQKTAIIAKAKAEGYDVLEKVVNNRVKLVLVRASY